MAMFRDTGGYQRSADAEFNVISSKTRSRTINFTRSSSTFSKTYSPALTKRQIDAVSMDKQISLNDEAKKVKLDISMLKQKQKELVYKISLLSVDREDEIMEESEESSLSQQMKRLRDERNLLMKQFEDLKERYSETTYNRLKLEVMQYKRSIMEERAFIDDIKEKLARKSNVIISDDFKSRQAYADQLFAAESAARMELTSLKSNYSLIESELSTILRRMQAVEELKSDLEQKEKSLLLIKHRKQQRAAEEKYFADFRKLQEEALN